jgi:eukaryotic-like serine/threonine-protein kinase
MATAGLNRMMLWGDYEGRRLDDRWLLGRLVRPEGRRAWFEAIGPDGLPVMLSITEALNDEDELVERLHAAAHIHHPNVVAIREAGISHLDDIPVVVAEMETTDENLADVLRERVLTPAEGRQVLDAVLAALGAIHAHGLVHKHVEAMSVVATGETIKLRSDCVQMAGSAFGAAAAEDVRWAARMVAHAVTGRFPASENDPVLQLLPESMARAVRRALSGIAGATEVAALAGTRLEIARDTTRIEPLSKMAKATSAPVSVVAPKVEAPSDARPAVAEKPAAMSVESAKAEAKVAGPAPSTARRVISMRPVAEQGGLFDEPLSMPKEETGTLPDDEGAEASRWPKAPYVIAAAIAVALVTVFTLYGLLHGQPAQQQPTAPATAATVTLPPGHSH